MSSWYYRLLSVNISVDYYRNALLHVLNFYYRLFWVNIVIDCRAVTIYYYRLISAWIIVNRRHSTSRAPTIGADYYLSTRYSTASSCLILSANEAVIMRIAAVWMCCFVADSHLFLPQPDKQYWMSHVRGHSHPVESVFECIWLGTSHRQNVKPLPVSW
jgi:hypothetical protein